METKNSVLKPFIGLDEITFKLNYDDVIAFLKNKKIDFNIEIWPNKGCFPEVAWSIIWIGKSISIFFALNKMFKIYVENDFSGTLNNGIKLKMTMEEATKIDPSLTYNDDEENYISSNGYWLEESLDSGVIESMTIFIKEIQDEEIFFSYKWCD